MSLAEQIERLRQQMVDAHTREMTAADALSAAMHEGDTALIDGLRTILSDQDKRRSEIAHLVRVLAQRVGHAPAPLQTVPVDGTPLPRILRSEGQKPQAYVPPAPQQPALPPHARQVTA